MKNIESIAQDLFDKIRSRFQPIRLRDEQGKPTKEEPKARFFNFVYASPDGTRHGVLTISIVDGKSLKAAFYRGIKKDFEGNQETHWEQFLRDMRNFSKRNMLSFDIRDITRSNLTQRHIDQVATSQKEKSSTVAESRSWSGTTRTSVQNFGPTRLIIRHTEAVNEEQPGARSRKIESMFVETEQGERFRMPYNRLSLGRAMAQHLAHGGKIYDAAGEHIQNMAEEMANLSFFVRNTRHREFEDTETQHMVEAAVSRYSELRNQLRGLSGTRNYQKFAESFEPQIDIDEEYDIDALKERFVKKMFDDRLTSALPYVYKAFINQQHENSYVREFKGWADDVINEQDFQDLDVKALTDLFSKPIKAGPGGIDAVSAIGSILDNEDLIDQIKSVAKNQGPETDVRSVIDSWLAVNINGYESLMPTTNPASDLPTEPEPEVPDSKTDSDAIVLKRLAGIR